MIKLSWKDVFRMIEEITKNISGRYSAVYGVPRGGIIPSVLLSCSLNLCLLETLDDTFFDGDILIVDDVIDSGKTRERYKRYNFISLWDKSVDKNEWVEFPWERMNNESPVEDSITRILEFIGEDIKREGLLETPKRVTASWKEIYSGYEKNPKDFVKIFSSEDYNEIILLKDIELYSMCEHHMLPFIGKAHIAYIPDKKIIGVSKLARILDIFARRLQIQERLGNQITQFFMDELEPKGVACVIEAEHLCTRMRGIQKQHSIMVTSSLKGVFLEKIESREELMRLIK